MEIKYPENRTFAVVRNEDGSVLHRVEIAPNQVMTTGQPIVESTESEAEHLSHIAPFVDQLPPLPDEGEPVEKGEIYAHAGGAVMARRDHDRTHHDPADVLALFVTYQGTADGLDWIAGETVALGVLREYEGETWRAIQSHTTEENWQPPNVPALWEVVVEPDPAPDGYPQWQAGIDVTVGEVYVYEGDHYRVRQIHTSADHWRPPDVPSLYMLVVNVNLGTSAQIETLSGVGPALAQSIIDGRPYAVVDDLVEVSGVSQSMVSGWEVIV